MDSYVKTSRKRLFNAELSKEVGAHNRDPANTVVPRKEMPVAGKTALSTTSIVRRIASHLDLPHKGRAAQVCRRWRDAIYHPSLWHLETAIIKTSSGDDDDHHHHRNQPHRAERNSWSPTLLASLVRRGITAVHFYDSYSSFSRLEKIARDLPNLQSLDLSGNRYDEYWLKWEKLSRLKELVLDDSFRRTGQSWSLLVTSLTNLTVLTLKSRRKFSETDKLDITDLSLFIISKSLVNLKCLRVAHCGAITDVGVGYLVGQGCSWSLKFLESLELLHCTCLTDTTLWHLSAVQVHLRRLSLSWNDFLSFSLGKVDSFRMPLLEELALVNCSKINGTSLRHIAKFNSLRELNLSSCTEIGDDGLKYLDNGCNSIDTLDLSGANKVTDIGLQRLARIRTLSRLNIAGCSGVTARGLAMLSKGAATIVDLNVTGCSGIGENCLLYITKYFPKLHTLCIDEKLTNEAGLASVPLKLRWLRTLTGIDYNPIGKTMQFYKHEGFF